MNWEEYLSFVKSVEVTPMHFTSVTINASRGDLIEINRMHHASLGLVGEAAEVSELVKKCLYGKRKPFTDETVEKLKDEMGDVFYYLTLGLDAVGLTLEDIMVFNKAKLSDRYPELLDAYCSKFKEAG